MSIRAEMFSRFANSADNFLQSGANLANSVVSYEGKKKQVTASNQFNLSTAYQEGLKDVMKNLPESVDFDSYDQRIQEYNNSFVSDARGRGIYDEKSLEWLENTFIPSQKAQTEASVGEIQNYAANNWLATQANGYAQVLAANPEFSVYTASKKYEEYYERIGLGKIENRGTAYGIMTPDEFVEAIRGIKAGQAFERISSDPESGYLFSKSYDMNKAMEQALAESGYKPDAIERAKFMSDCNASLAKMESALKDNVSSFCDQIEGQFNELKMSDSYSSTVFDLTDAYEAAKGFPAQYMGKFVDLAAKIESHNADVQYDVATSLIQKGVVDNTVIEMLDAGYATTHAEKFRKAREEAVTKKIMDTARANGNNDAGQVLNYIYSGDVGIDVTPEERFKAANSFVSSIDSAYKTISDYDDLALKLQDDRQKGSPVPEILSVLYDVNVTSQTVADNGQVSEKTETVSLDDVAEGKVPAGSTVELSPKYNFEFRAGNSVPLAEKKLSPETEKKTQTAEVAATSTAGDDDSRLPSVFTGSALNKATDSVTDVSTGNAQVNNIDAQEEVKDLLRKGAPQEVINAVVYYHEKKGNLSEEWISQNYNQKNWRESHGWGLIEQRIDDLAKDTEINSSTLRDVKDRITNQIVEAFRFSGQTWDEFEKNSLTKLSDMLYSQEILSENMSRLELLNKMAQNADSYYETMTSNGMYGQVFQDYAQGKFDAIIDHGMVQQVQDMNLVGIDAIRDEFAKRMNHSSYQEAVDTDPTGMTKLMIETMASVVSMHNEAGEFYSHVIDRLGEHGIQSELLGFTVDKDLGYVFFDSNSVAKGYALCIDPELMVYDADSGISSQWKYVPCVKDDKGNYKVKKDWGYGDMGEYATVGSNLFVSTAKKPTDKQMAMEQEGVEQVKSAEQGMQKYGTNAATIGEMLGGFVKQIFGRVKTKTYKEQSASEEATFITAYKTAFEL